QRDLLRLIYWLPNDASGLAQRFHVSAANFRNQCTLTGSSSWLQALASAASRVSVNMIGVPSAACRENSLRPGAIFGACGNRLATSSARIVLTYGGRQSPIRV